MNPLQAAPGRRPPAAPGPRPRKAAACCCSPWSTLSFWLVCALLPFALRQPRHPGHAGRLGPRRSTARASCRRAEQPDEPRRDRRSAADERLRSTGRGPLAAAPGRRAIPRRRPLVLAGLVLAWQLRPTGEERSWTG
ncbi:hypothetical protein ACPA9J_12945 [Pseudomonas aeruginosa]